MDHYYRSSEEASQLFPSDNHFDPALNGHATTVNEVECIVGADYFAIGLQVYGFNSLYGVIFRVSSACRPLDPILPIPTPGNSIVLQDTSVRTTTSGGLECLRPGSPQWEQVELFLTFGDARPTDPSLLNSMLGIDLGSIEDVEGLFYSYGNPPTRESIDKWVEQCKAIRAPSICPLNNCKQSLRRPHALKAIWHTGFKCNNAGCNSSFSTKTNCDRHIKDFLVPATVVSLSCTLMGIENYFIRKDERLLPNMYNVLNYLFGRRVSGHGHSGRWWRN
ncbi:hypothetical protein B0J17DRAFT_632715 [Rhizoctonia solani]|nr:hypothetical protein B0J17DRAFT_632715 [Rhizoctonia solani]